ncbi:MAG TPA: MFS transporter [bacterium]|nr:MFS transporter [bacterium]
MKLPKNIPKTVLLLGAASFFTDVSSEGIYSILPLFLTQVLGAGPLALGVIEGVAETTSSLLKVFSGIWTDRLRQRKPLILWGYGLSTFARPFIGAALSWPWVLFLRFLDRMGKGVRSSPRDALITDVTTDRNRGTAFGLHGSMDHAGALLGPLLVSLILTLGHLSLRTIIYLSIVPGLIAWLTLWVVPEKKKKSGTKSVERPDLLKGWSLMDPRFKTLLLAMFFFGLGNSTDAFLIIQLSKLGVPMNLNPLIWGLFSGVMMVTSYWGGKLSDRFGRKPLILAGWAFYALVYFAFAHVQDPWWFTFIFLAYGTFYGLCEPSQKAFVGDMAKKTLRGTAFGLFNLTAGLAALPASLIFGFVGQKWGYSTAFTLGACFALAASLILLWIPSRK